MYCRDQKDSVYTVYFICNGNTTVVSVDSHTLAYTVFKYYSKIVYSKIVIM